MKANIIMLSLLALVTLASCGTKKEDPSAVAAKLLKDKGIEIPFHPSVDFTEFLRQYKANPDLWDAAFAFLAENGPGIHELTDFGTTELVGKRCYVTVAEFEPRPFPETKLEGHRKYIDIQLTEGPVRWGICPSDNDKLQTLEEYNAEGDYALFLSDDTVYYDQPADHPSIFIFFPRDLHNPSFAAEGVGYPSPLHKIVVKVEAAE